MDKGVAADLIHQFGGRFPASFQGIEEGVHRLVGSDGHLGESRSELLVAMEKGDEQEMEREVVDHHVLVLPIGIDGRTPLAHDVLGGLADDEAALDEGVGELAMRTVEEERAVENLGGDGSRQQTGGVYPAATMTRQGVNTEDVGEMGIGDLALLPLLDDVGRQVDILGKVRGCQDDERTTLGMLLDRADAVLNELRCLLPSLKPTDPDGCVEAW